MRRLADILLASLIPFLVLLHLVVAPYSKVEESFNMQATHDILEFGLPVKQIESTLRAQYDHLTFPSPVPRTFIGSLAVAGASWPLHYFVEGKQRLIMVRAILGLFNAFCLLSFRNGVARSYGRHVANWYTILQASQFHMMYYASRTLPNFYAFGLSTLALRDLLPRPDGDSKKKTTANRLKRGLFLLTATGVVFRSELAILLFTHVAWLLVNRRLSFYDIVLPGLLGLEFGLALTFSIDSYFHLTPVWPELSSLVYNVVHNQSTNWGTSPYHTYLTSSLPRLLLNPLAFPILFPFAALSQALRASALNLVVPNLMFILIYSFQPHKEWRFIIYIIPPLTAVTALSASWVWTRRTKSMAYRLLAYAILASTLASFAASFAMLAISRVNYPGAEALNRLHVQARGSKPTLRVHLDTLSCMTGVTRFLELPATSTDGGTMWLYDKTEDQAELLHPLFWDRFDYVLAERPEKVIGKWEVVDVVDGFAGIGVIDPGMEKEVTSDHARETDGVWEGIERFLRKHVTRGWWINVKMEPKIRILKRQGGEYAQHGSEFTASQEDLVEEGGWELAGV